MERCIYVQLEKYLSSNELIYPFQSGFRPGFSTDTCLILAMTTEACAQFGQMLLSVQQSMHTLINRLLSTETMSQQPCMDWYRGLTDA